MNCPYCGAKINNNDSFCPKCGNKLTNNSQNYQKNNQNNNQNQNKNSLLIVILVVLVVIVSALSGLVFISYNKDNENIKQKAAHNTFEPQETALPTENNAGTETDNSNYADGDGYYSPYWTYKGMPEIYESVLSSQSSFDWVTNLIYSFDMDCKEYMNNGAEVPSQLLEGSNAYLQQTDYKQRHPNMTQTYDLIDVMNVRENGNYYFAWVNERLTQVDSGIERIENDYWVYKLVDRNGSLYIVDYIYDPAHKYN